MGLETGQHRGTGHRTTSWYWRQKNIVGLETEQHRGTGDRTTTDRQNFTARKRHVTTFFTTASIFVTTRDNECQITIVLKWKRNEMRRLV